MADAWAGFDRQQGIAGGGFGPSDPGLGNRPFIPGPVQGTTDPMPDIPAAVVQQLMEAGYYDANAAAGTDGKEEFRRAVAEAHADGWVPGGGDELVPPSIGDPQQDDPYADVPDPRDWIDPGAMWGQYGHEPWQTPVTPPPVTNPSSSGGGGGGGNSGGGIFGGGLMCDGLSDSLKEPVLLLDDPVEVLDFL